MKIDNLNQVIRQCRESHSNAPLKINGQQAWIFIAPWGAGVRYYPIDIGYRGLQDKTRDGLITLIEKL